MNYKNLIKEAKMSIRYFHYLCDVLERNGYIVRDICSRYQYRRRNGLNISPNDYIYNFLSKIVSDPTLLSYREFLQRDRLHSIN